MLCEAIRGREGKNSRCAQPKKPYATLANKLDSLSSRANFQRGTQRFDAVVTFLELVQLQLQNAFPRSSDPK